MNTSVVSVMGRIINLKEIYKIREIETKVTNNYPIYHFFVIDFFEGKQQTVSVHTDLYYHESTKEAFSYKEYKEYKEKGNSVSKCTPIPYSSVNGYSGNLDFKEKLEKLEAVRTRLIELWEKNKLDVVYLEL